jgi:hypothetical protein
MTTTLLYEVGEALYGPRWQTEMARDLGCSDRTVRRWAAKEWDVPRTVWEEIHALLVAREKALAALRYKIPR